MPRLKRGILVVLLITLSAWTVYVRIGGLEKRRFWRDEAWVATAVTCQSCKQLISQTELPMPPLFAVTVKLVSALATPPELGMRLLPLISGVIGVLLTYPLLRTLRIPRTVSIVVMALCASSLILVITSRELKHYQVEATIGVLMALMVFRMRWHPNRRLKWIEPATILSICLIGPWLAYGTLFPAITMIFILMFLPSRHVTGSRHLWLGAAAAGTLLLSTATLYHFVASSQASNPALLRWTSHWFVHPLDFHDWCRAGYYGLLSTARTFVPLSAFGSGMGTSTANPFLLVLISTSAWILAGVGLWHWPGRGRKEVVCMVLGPWLLMLLAALFQCYPFAAPRMMAACALPLVLAMGVGLVKITRSLSVILLGRGSPGLVLAMCLSTLPALYMANVPTRNSYWPNQDYPALLDILDSKRSQEEVVLVTLNATPNVEYYAPDLINDAVFTPTQAGTLLSTDFDHQTHLDRILDHTGDVWWIVSCSDEWPIQQYKRIKDRGYKVELVFGNLQDCYGSPLLFKLTRKTSHS